MTTPDLAAIRKRAEKAKLPLSVSDTSSYSCGPIQNAPGLNVRDCEGWYDFFISRAGHTVQSWEEIKAKVLSINDIPALLAHIDAQAARIRELEAADGRLRMFLDDIGETDVDNSVGRAVGIIKAYRYDAANGEVAAPPKPAKSDTTPGAPQ